MKTYAWIGIALILIAITAFAYQGISFTTSVKDVDLNSIQTSADQTRTIPFPQVVGGIALMGGILLLVEGRRRRMEGEDAGHDAVACLKNEPVGADQFWIEQNNVGFHSLKQGAGKERPLLG